MVSQSSDSCQVAPKLAVVHSSGGLAKRILRDAPMCWRATWDQDDMTQHIVKQTTRLLVREVGVCVYVSHLKTLWWPIDPLIWSTSVPHPHAIQLPEEIEWMRCIKITASTAEADQIIWERVQHSQCDQNTRHTWESSGNRSLSN